MAYITMCKGEDCKHKYTCSRYTLTPEKEKEVFAEIPLEDGKCEMYWGKNQTDILSQLKEITNE